MKRRTLLKASSVFAIPAIVPSKVLGANAPSNRVNLGFIGVGKQANAVLIKAFLNRDDTQILAFCDPESKRLETAKTDTEKHYAEKSETGSYESVSLYNRFEDLLARDDLDGVVIATPDHWHALIAIAACRAGKDIYCEKPATLTIGEAIEMMNVVKRHKRVFQTGSMQRSGWMFRYACELVRNGRIGDLKKVKVKFGVSWVEIASIECNFDEQPMPDELDWERWIGPSPMQPYNQLLCPDHTKDYPRWRNYRGFGGGALTDWGAHHFDIVNWAFGMDRSGPIEVVPFMDKGKQAFIYKFENGLQFEHNENFDRSGIEFIGRRGSIRVNRWWIDTTPKRIMKQPTLPTEVNLYESNSHYGDWLECIRTRRNPVCDVETGCRSAIACHLGNIAARTGRTVKWDPKKLEIADDDSWAKSLVNKSYRAPWSL